MELEIVKLEPVHWDRVRQIYVEGLRTGRATFETEAQSWGGGSGIRHTCLLLGW